MKRSYSFVLLLMSSLVLCGSLCGQSLKTVIPKAPSAVSAEAPMPQAMAKAIQDMEREKRQKFCNVQVKPAATIDSKVIASYNKYIYTSGDNLRISAPTAGYVVSAPLIRIINSSVGYRRMNWGSREHKFCEKNDYLQNIAIRNGRFQIFNNKNNPCKMEEFTFEPQDKFINMVNNRIELKASAAEVASGVCPRVHEIIVRHNKSALTFKMKVELYFPQSEYCGSQHKELVFAMPEGLIDSVAVKVDLANKTIDFVELPYTLYGSGSSGSDGRRGSNGVNGRNQSEYTDKDGKKHVIVGTCGKPGGNGENGEDGKDGATMLICISPRIYAHNRLKDINLTVNGGKGGSGGIGGLGGKHGTGSGCQGIAPNGNDGKDGKDGKRGDFLFVMSDAETFVNSLNIR